MFQNKITPLNPETIQSRESGFIVLRKKGHPHALIQPFIMLWKVYDVITIHTEFRPNVFGTKKINIYDRNIIFVKTEQQAKIIAESFEQDNIVI